MFQRKWTEREIDLVKLALDIAGKPYDEIMRISRNFLRLHGNAVGEDDVRRVIALNFHMEPRAVHF